MIYYLCRNLRVMTIYEKIPAVLVLEDGSVFQGNAAGKIGTTTGEICFNTGMTGYQEIFTDPSYFGQIMVTTNVHIGNYGIHEEERESNEMKISGLVCRNFSTNYSRVEAKESIQDYFMDQGVVGISNVDTRQIVRHIRSKGAMNAIISSETTDVEELLKKLKDVPSMVGLELSSVVSTKESYEMGEETAEIKVAVLDLGVKRNILKCLVSRGCKLKVFPAKTTYKEMMEYKPDGFFISNGPGDPSAMPYAVETVKEILDNNHPLFGICLGHQILAQACGMTTYKMHHGHRGLNHPVKNLLTGGCEITSQNHGFAVDEASIKACKDAELTHINLNDQSVEGLRVINKTAFSVQYHPESSPGPHDSRYLFDDFIKSIVSVEQTA
jgi:carbamoyl-phosphate synthase small subunit